MAANAENPVSTNSGYQSLDPFDPSLQSVVEREDDMELHDEQRDKRGCCSCCDNGNRCDNCVIKYSRCWLGCGTSQFGYSVIVWYILNLGLDIYSLVTASGSRLNYVLYTFGVFLVDLPVLFFTVCPAVSFQCDGWWRLPQTDVCFQNQTTLTVCDQVRDQQYKLVFPFCCQMAMFFVSAIYTIDKEVDPNWVNAGFWTLATNTLFDVLGALSLIPLMTHRIPLWEKTDIGYSRLYPYSSKYDREIAVV